VDFACAQPKQLEVMFRPRQRETEGPPPQALVAVGTQAFSHLIDAVRACQEQGLAPQATARRWPSVPGAWCTASPASGNQGQLGALVADGSQFERQRDQLLRNLQAGWQATARNPVANAGDPEVL
jgi:hypothetical protein